MDLTAKKPMSRLENHYLITNIKGIMIIVLAIYHCMLPGLSRDSDFLQKDGPLFQAFLTGPALMLFLSAVPLFVFLTGYNSKNVDECRNSAFSTALIPYLLLQLFASVFFPLLAGQAIYIDMFNPYYQLWYLLSMFIWYMLLKDIVRIKFALPISVVLSLAVSMCINESGFVLNSGMGVYMSLSHTVVFLPFLLCGYYATPKLIDKLRSCSAWKAILSAIIFIAISSAIYWAFANVDWLMLENYFSLKGDSKYLDSFLIADSNGVRGINSYWGCNLAGMILRLLQYLCSFLVLVVLIRFVPKKKVPLLSKIGNAALTVFSLHAFIVLPLGVILVKLNPVIFTLLSVVVSVAACILFSLNIVHKNYTKLIFAVSDIITLKPKKQDSK